MSRKVMLHECEHIIEMCWANTEDEIVSKSGFDCVSYVEDEECYDGTNLDFGFSSCPYETRPLRKFEIISEVWNDLLAHILYYHSKNCGLEIGTVGLNESWYVKCMRLISPLDSYLDVILDARMNSDFNAFENLFGKDCSNELNEVINRYYKLVTDGGIKFMGFEKHIERITGQTIAEIDFLNLPPKEQWSEFEKQVIALHQEMAALTKRINKRFTESEWNESVQDGNESE
jgi:hypothetical protein